MYEVRVLELQIPEDWQSAHSGAHTYAQPAQAYETTQITMNQVQNAVHTFVNDNKNTKKRFSDCLQKTSKI